MSSNITVTTGNAVTNITVTSGIQNVFRTIATDSGSAVTDSTTDILTFTGAGGLTTSADSGTDTVTFTQGAPNISSNSVGHLSDVDITTSAPTTNQVLLFNSTSNKFVPGDVSSGAGYQSTNLLNDLDDVTMGSTSEGQILVFDASAPTQFVNRNLSGAVTLDGDGVTALAADTVNDTHIDFGTGTNQVNTDDLPEGSTNQYFTTTRARASISASGSLSYDNSTGAMTYTQGAIDADSVTVSNLEVDNLKATTLVTESEGIASNDNDTTLPTSAAVKDYVDGQILTKDNTDEITEGSTNLYFTDARARASISASGSLSYNSSTGAMSYTQGAIDADSVTVSNLEVDNLKSGVLDTDLSSVAGTDTTLASAKAIKSYVDSQILTKDNTDEITEGSTNLYFTDARARAVSIENAVSYTHLTLPTNC